MEFDGEYHIAATREQVWRALNDPAILLRAVPGCEALEKTSDSEFIARVTLKIGPVKAKFKGRVTLGDLDPPNGYSITGEGQGGVAGFAKGSARVQLTEDGDGTCLRYQATATVGGKLAQVGQRMITAAARKLATEFFTNLGEAMASPEAAPPPPPLKQEPAAGLNLMAWVIGVLLLVIALLAYFGV